MDDTAFAETFVRFARELRAAGIAVGTGDISAFYAAVGKLDPTDLLDLYWAGRAALVKQQELIADYDRVFRAFFLGTSETVERTESVPEESRSEVSGALTVPQTESGGTEQAPERTPLGLAAANVTALRTKAFSECTPEELDQLRRIMRSMRLTAPQRRTRRTRKARSGRIPDPRRTARHAMRMHGDPSELFWRQRKLRVRPLVLILDVSGSMADYSRSLLQFAHSTSRGSTSRVEVFCFGTRLSRITTELDDRRPDAALEQAANVVADWEGGTKIGDSLTTFVRDWGRRGICRGGVVVICSDGLDRGDPAVLAKAMERLARLSHRIVWLDPHHTEPGDFTPNALGMIAAAPHVDEFLPGHDLRSLEKLAHLLPTLR